MTITNTLSSNFITAAPEHAAVAELAQRYGPQVYRVAHRLLGDTAQAEDVQQDGFLRLLESGSLAVAYWPAYLSTLVWFPIGSLNCFRAFWPEGVGVRRRHSPAMAFGPGPQQVACVLAGARHAAQAAGFHPPIAWPRAKVNQKFLHRTSGQPH